MAVRPKLRDAWRRLRGGEVTPLRAAASVAVGLAIGATPLYGFHWALVLAVCVPLKLDAAVAYLAANISLPFIAPFLTVAEIETGARIRTGHTIGLSREALASRGLGAFAAEVAIGTAALSVALAAVGFAITYALVAWRARKR